jgi:hypothetical protein
VSFWSAKIAKELWFTLFPYESVGCRSLVDSVLLLLQRNASSREKTRNDFLYAHHRVASLYFAITAVEAQLNQTIRQLRKKQSADDSQIETDIRRLNLAAKFRQFAELNQGPPLQAASVATILNANRVRNELTHRKTWGYETYEASMPLT